MNDEAKKRLRGLATGSAGRSKKGQLRGLMQDIETALAAGVKQQTIIDELAGVGLKISLPAFRQALCEIRKETKKQEGTGKPTSTPDVLPVAKSEIEQAPTPRRQRNIDLSHEDKPPVSNEQNVFAQANQIMKAQVVDEGPRRGADEFKNIINSKN